MHIYVATCDKYDHLMPGFAHQFNKYWSPQQQVDVLGFRKPALALPDNFVFHQMEPVETQAWTTNLRAFFERIDDSHFTFLLDDYWLTAPVDMVEVGVMENFVTAGAVKGDLSENTKNFAHHQLDPCHVVATPTAAYRTSTQPCIWSRRFMLDLLVPGLNPWQFELQDNIKAREGRVVGPTWQIFQFANMYYKGKPAQYMFDRISDADKAELRRIGALDGIIS